MSTSSCSLGFGKFESTPISSVPLNYLNWIIKADKFFTLNKEIQDEVNEQIAKRSQEVTEVFKEVTKTKTIKALPKFRLPYVRVSEANIQAECYHQLKLRGIDSYLEFKHDHCIFDMIIYDKKNDIIAIVEFKSRKEVNKDKVYMTKQIFRYSQYGVPVLFCNHLSQVADTVDTIQKLLNTRKLQPAITAKKVTKEI